MGPPVNAGGTKLAIPLPPNPAAPVADGVNGDGDNGEPLKPLNDERPDAFGAGIDGGLGVNAIGVGNPGVPRYVPPKPVTPLPLPLGGVGVAING
jgi:hypothetical protein